MRRCEIDPAARHRGFHLIQGEASACRAKARAETSHKALWLDDQSTNSLRCLLGQETDELVFDALDAFDADAFAIASGLVRGGGDFYLLTPPLEVWEASGRFQRRFARLIRQFSASPPDHKVFAQSGGCFRLTGDQQAALDTVIRVANGHRHRPLAISADRGRGKSSVLGIAAARLLFAGKKRILVTAPRLSATDTLFELAARELPQTQASRGRITFEGREIRFIAPDELIAQQPPASLLIVDEAAGIPIPLLEKMVKRYPRLVFSTTVHGYEGSGRGFALRFAALLDRLTPRWKALRMTQPVRWAEGDPLEAFVFRALLLDAEVKEAGEDDFRKTGAQALQVGKLERERLVEDEALLRQLFGLLIGAHYRTRPNDLQYLLDTPEVTIWSAFSDDILVGAALVAAEGPIPQELHQPILQGRRRLKGHRLPQALASQCGQAAALALRCWRIVRIAVHPQLQGRGVGSRLLQAIVDSAGEEELTGSQFGASPELVRFWQRNGFVAARLGYRKEASSGAHSVIMLHSPKTGAHSAGLLIHRVRGRFLPQFPLQLGEPFATLDAELARLLLQGNESIDSLDPQTLAELQEYARGQRQYLDVLRPLHLLASRMPSPLLIMKVLQHRSWSDISRERGWSGKAEAEAALRREVAATIDLAQSHEQCR